MTTETDNISTAKENARAEIEAYRTRVRADQEAKQARNLSAEEEIASAILARREEEERRERVNAERKAFLEAREAKLEEQRKADRERRVAADPRLAVAATPAGRIARRLLDHLGTELDAVRADLRQTSSSQVTIALDRLIADERNAATARERAAAAARAAEELVASVRDPAELAILERHGLSVAARRDELAAGAL